ncbi:MAG: adenylate/guanylate cyclase domain-containing protein [Thermomicrobiales bacterium]
MRQPVREAAISGDDIPVRLRTLLLLAALALPLLGLALLVTRPHLDVDWQHNPAHFWIVLSASALNFVLAYATGSAATQRNDARVYLVSLGFLAAAGFLGLHALVTPGVLIAGPNAGFHLASPIGLLTASLFAAASSERLDGGQASAVMRKASLIRALLIALMVGWGLVSLLDLPPLNGATPPVRQSLQMFAIAIPGVVLYGIAVFRYLRLARGSSAPALPLAMAAAFTLLAEAEIAIAFSRNWHASWWEWHLLMLAAFGLIALSANRQWHEERFASLYLEETAKGTREVSIIFADLQGFTAFSERHDSREVSEMLNAYFSRAIPSVTKRFGGHVDRIMGDALMVTFNMLGDQPDHADRAARAAFAIQNDTGEIADQHPNWPRFRIGINTGVATVAVLGAEGGRTYSVIGDTVNTASRLEGMAQPGGIVIGAETARRLQGANLEMLGEMNVKGKSEPVMIYRLLGL